MERYISKFSENVNFDFKKHKDNIRHIDVTFVNKDSFDKKNNKFSKFTYKDKTFVHRYEAKDYNKINFNLAIKVVVEFIKPIGITKSDIGNGYIQDVNKYRLRIK